MDLIWNLCAVIYCLAVAKCGAEEDIESKRSKEGRKGKIFSLFNIVQFKQESCATAVDPTMSGTCMTGSECVNAGGSSGGNCAAGFGVCCMFLSKCGSGTTSLTVSRNCTYLEE